MERKRMYMESNGLLVQLCIEEACSSIDTVEIWRRQRRSLERLPSHLADALIRRLLQRRLLLPSLLEVFKYSVEKIDLRGQSSVDAEWMAYLGAFTNLCSLNLADSQRITDSALWPVTGMSCLKELDLSRCYKVTDAGIRHLLAVPTLEKLWISETRVTADGVTLLSWLKNLTLLDLGGLPVTDTALNCLQVLTKLEYIDLWGSKITNKGALFLPKFPKLTYLNLGWTSVTKLPKISSLECLNMSNCTLKSLLEGSGDKAPLKKLVLSATTFTNETEAFANIETSFLSFLDLSETSLQRFDFLSRMNMLENLNLSSTLIDDDSIESIASIGPNLRNLCLSKTRVSATGIEILAGHVPILESLNLSDTSIEDDVISYISMMPKLKVIDLSKTKLKGFVRKTGPEPNVILSLSELQNLDNLEILNLEETQMMDAALYPLTALKNLSHLSLRNVSLTDACLQHLSSLPKLLHLGIRDALLTREGLESVRLHSSLKTLDIRGCWLLTQDNILSLLKRYPQFEIKHELAQYSNRASASREKQPKKVTLAECVIDQRVKYTREELLLMQFSSLSLASPHDKGIAIPPMLLD